MSIVDVTTAGALPALEMTIRFAGQRQRIIAHNIANFETPEFQPKDVAPETFQQTLGKAIDERRARNGGGFGHLQWRQTRQLRRGPAGDLALHPLSPSENILYHDRNNRDIERTMQSLVENTGVFRVATELYRQQGELLRAALRERA